MPTTRITVYRNNNPLKSASVSLEYTGFLQMGFTNSVTTNTDGVAYINHRSTGRANVYINGSKMSRPIITPCEEIYYL